jgi:BTB/POZ domain-containing protein 9
MIFLQLGKLDLSFRPLGFVIGLRMIVRQFLLFDVEKAIIEHLLFHINIGSVLTLIQHAKVYESEVLLNRCMDFIDGNANEVLDQQEFLEIDLSLAREILKRDTLAVKEMKVFDTIVRRIKNTKSSRQKSDNYVLFDVVRLHSISNESLITTVKRSGFYDELRIRKVISEKELSISPFVPLRAKVLHGENIVSECYNTKLVSGERFGNFLFFSHFLPSWDVSSGIVQINSAEGIVIELSSWYKINTVYFDLPTEICGALINTSYYLEVSKDKERWVRVVDHSNAIFRSWQYIRFNSEVVKFIRLVITSQTVNNACNVPDDIICFEIYSFGCGYDLC